MGNRSPVFSQEVLARINRAVRDNPGLTRRQLSVQVCDWLEWRCPKGRPRQMSCRVRLLDLHRKGQIVLPAPRRCFQPGVRRHGLRKPAAPPPIVPVSGGICELGPVELVPVRSADRELLSIHNALIEAYHYLGTSGLCGAQLRYLVRCKAGWIGALSFSGAALQCAPRDEFIGWDVAARRRNRERVVCNSRFLIRPEVEVEHLASHLLGMAARRLRKDWQERYGIDPVLVETFVDPKRFEGTCYRAANWREVGQTTGRGRGKRERGGALFPKKIFLLPLHRSFRRILCEEPPAPASAALVPLPVEEALEESWSEREFGAADLPDKRLNRRLIALADRFAACPRDSIAAACHDKAEAKAAYRFIDHEATTLPKILAPHYEATRRRCASKKAVLTAQDTSFRGSHRFSPPEASLWRE